MPTHIPVESMTDEIAESIKKVSDAAESMERSGLSRRAIVVLLQESIGSRRVTRDQILLVLDHLPRLKKIYLKDGGK